MVATSVLLLGALRDPEQLPTLTLTQWDHLLRQARRADLLGRIEAMLSHRALFDRVPTPVRPHLEAARILSEGQRDEVRREVGHLQAVLSSLGIPLVLLKGAAYVEAALPPAAGRMFSDIDLLVPRERLSEVEALLMLHGWATSHHNDYDQRYYREWMHELPPMQHLSRQTVVDVHHAILPVTARLKPPSAALLAAARPLPGRSGLAVPCDTDLLLHSVSHLFHNDDLSHGLRDLSDIDLLLRHFGADPTFWQRLVERARLLDLRRPLHYALRQTRRLLGTPVPAAAVAAVAQGAGPRPVDAAMNALWEVVLGQSHLGSPGAARSLCGFMLYVRAHWMRMPPLLLARHLTVKALRLHDPKQAAPTAR